MLTDVSHGPPVSVLARLWGFRDVWTRGWKSFGALCSSPQSRLFLPAASCHAPIAPDCLIGTFQVRGPDKPGQSSQTVIHLFSSRRCSCPLSLRSPRGIGLSWRSKSNLKARQKKINDKWLGLFSWSSERKEQIFFPHVPILLTYIPFNHSK